jgi:hypothetical protein
MLIASVPACALPAIDAAAVAAVSATATRTLRSLSVMPVSLVFTSLSVLPEVLR